MKFAVVCPAAFACALLVSTNGLNLYAATPAACAPVNGIQYMAIPEDVSRADVLRGGEPVATRLHELARRHLAGCPVESTPTGVPDSRVDAVVVFVDGEGQPILPELEAVTFQREGIRGTPSLAPGSLSFTFNSPSYPWSSAERATLQTQLGNFYPEARIVYGDPAFSIVVNIRKDPTITAAGIYYPSLNEMVVQNASNPDVLCHEMIHAFRDDVIIGLRSFEEGMTRAAEVEVFDRLSAYTHWDENHRYHLDVWYEGLNRKAIGSAGGDFNFGYVSPLLRYQLSGYAWGKVYLENSSFFVNFNQALYASAVVDPAVLGNESQLVRLATNAQPSVEGVAFSSWYANQFVLNTHPPVGTFLYQRLYDPIVDFFVRSASGSETMQGHAAIGWSVYDYLGTLMDSGSVTTSSLGWSQIHPSIPAGYSGRIRMAVTATHAGATVSDTTLRPWNVGEFNAAERVFGIVTAFNSGTVTITPLTGPGAPTTVNVANGAFSTSALTATRGRFLAVFNGAPGQSVSKVFTKDASGYYLVMGENADPCVGPDVKVTRSGGLVTVSWTPHGTSAYDVVRGSLPVLRSSGGNFTQALGAISPASQVCVADNTSSLAINDTRPLPPANSGEFYLVRALTCGAGGTYDSGAYSQVSPRDSEIAAASGACP